MHWVVSFRTIDIVRLTLQLKREKQWEEGIVYPHNDVAEEAKQTNFHDQNRQTSKVTVGAFALAASGIFYFSETVSCCNQVSSLTGCYPLFMRHFVKLKTPI